MLSALETHIYILDKKLLEYYLLAMVVSLVKTSLWPASAEVSRSKAVEVLRIAYRAHTWKMETESEKSLSRCEWVTVPQWSAPALLCPNSSRCRRGSPFLPRGIATGTERLNNAQKGNVKEEKDVMADIFQCAWWQTGRSLQLLEDPNDFYSERLGLVKLKSWSHGYVALLGDAAYCMAATTGMRTTSSLVGAYILAGEISKHHGTKDDLSTALKAYDQTFWLFMDSPKEAGKGIQPFGIGSHRHR